MIEAIITAALAALGLYSLVRGLRSGTTEHGGCEHGACDGCGGALVQLTPAGAAGAAAGRGDRRHVGAAQADRL